MKRRNHPFDCLPDERRPLPFLWVVALEEEEEVLRRVTRSRERLAGILIRIT